MHMTLYTAAVTLFLVMDPLGNIPAFLAVLNSVSPQRRKWIILREMIIAFIILLVFLFFGKQVLQRMDISNPALSIAGGIVLFLIAIKMIFPSENNDKIKQIGEPFIVPLAVPLIAGPSTMAFVMLLATQDPQFMWQWAIALTIAWIASVLILLPADYLRKILGERGLIAIERLMGMILTTLAVQMFLAGIQAFFHLSK